MGRDCYDSYSRTAAASSSKAAPVTTESTRGLTRGFCELTLEADDPAALASFYRDLFGWAEPSREKDQVWLECGAGRTRSRVLA